MRPASTLLGTSLVVFLIYSLGGCPTPTPVPPVFEASDATADAPSVVVLSDASLFDVSLYDAEDTPTEDTALSPACVKACKRLAEWGCPEAKKPDGGKTCYQVCSEAELSGKFSLKPQCVANATTLVELKACKTVRCMK